MALRVLHLVGSAQDAFMADLSRLYARDCLATVEDPLRYEPLIAYVAPDRSWRFPASLDRAAIAAARPVALPEALTRIADDGIELMVPQMFCLPGMTEYRSLFDLLEIPYLGNRAETMALGADKARAKAVVAAAGVATAHGVVVDGGDGCEREADRALAAPALPLVVKPVEGDNSLGVSLVHRAGELPAAIALACAHGGAALVEQYVELGREVRCGLLERDGELVALPLEEYAVDPATKPIRDHDDKLRRAGSGELALVAKDDAHAWTVAPDDPVCGPVWAAARACHRALGCRDYSLFDFRIDRSGRPVFLEAGLYCSFARRSVITTMAAAAQITAEDLFATAVRQTLHGRSTSPTTVRSSS